MMLEGIIGLLACGWILFDIFYFLANIHIADGLQSRGWKRVLEFIICLPVLGIFGFMRLVGWLAESGENLFSRMGQWFTAS